MSLISELKRRNVFRVSAAYLALGWVITQVTATVVPVLNLPAVIVPIVVWIGVIGFPCAVVFSWVYELTPEGFKREHEVERSESITHETARRLDLLTIGFVIFGALLAVLQQVRAPPAVSTVQQPAAGNSVAPAQDSTVGAGPARDSSSNADNRTQGALPPADERSIAVLPFTNISSDAEQEYFSDGLSEELLNLLAKIPELKVTSRSSAFFYKGKDVKLEQVARELRVAHVLEGSVRKSGSKVRITAQLIDTRTDTHLWSETYDRTLEDIFVVQDEIARAVVEQLKIKLLSAAPRSRETDPRAYALHLQANQLSRQYTAAGYEQAIALFGQVLEIDPAYVPALVRLSLTYANQAIDGLRPAEEGFRLAREAADKALAIDPQSAPAHAVLSVIAFNYTGDLAAAARHANNALALEPGNTTVLTTAAILAQNLGRPKQAIAINQALIANDPVSAVGHANLGNFYLSAGRPDDAIASWRTALALNPGYGGAQASIGLALLSVAKPEDALAAIQQEPFESYRLPVLAMALHALGKPAESEAMLAEAMRKYAQETACAIAGALAFRGEIDRAFEWLDRAVANHDPSLAILVNAATDPGFATLRDDPRWLPFLRRIGKAPEQLAAIEFDVKLPP